VLTFLLALAALAAGLAAWREARQVEELRTELQVMSLLATDAATRLPPMAEPAREPLYSEMGYTNSPAVIGPDAAGAGAAAAGEAAARRKRKHHGGGRVDAGLAGQLALEPSRAAAELP